jgi:hypothetical protein
VPGDRAGNNLIDGFPTGLFADPVNHENKMRF